jgi:hypothetical protein
MALIHQSFTVKHDGIARELRTEVYIEAPLGPQAKVPPHPSNGKVKAIWDTGATNSAISTALVASRNMQPTGMTQIHGVHGLKDCNTYLVSIYLPNSLVIPVVEAAALDLGDDGVLIGMDIIAQGDFSITNMRGETWFSFRMPSLQRFDHVVHSPHLEHGCTCGSGKRYKNCCYPHVLKI